LTIDRELENAATAGDQGECLHSIAVPLKDLLRQTGGPGQIVSLHAIFQTDLHFFSSFGFKRNSKQRAPGQHAKSAAIAPRYLQSRTD